MKKTGNTVISVVAILIALPILIIAVSNFINSLDDRKNVSRLANTKIPGTNGVEVYAFVAVPEGKGPFPAVIMIHEWWGIRPDIVSKAAALSSNGYIVAAVDVYRGQTTHSIPRAIALVSSHKTPQVMADIDAAYRWLSARPDVKKDRIGITGFCFGGTQSLLYSLRNPGIRADAIFYGSGITTNVNELKTLKAPVLGIFGEKDATLPMKKVAAFSNALAVLKIPAEIAVYPGEDHAFVKGYDSILTNAHQKAAWEQMLRFFDKYLKK